LIILILLVDFNQLTFDRLVYHFLLT